MRGGLIVAGGRSTRFGETDKAVAHLAGRPMIRRVADRLEPVIDRLTINCRPDQADAIRDAMEGYPAPLSYRLDDEPDQGPLAGIATGLRGGESDATFVVACDMPFVDPVVIELLFERLGASDAAVPRPDKWFEPLHAVYRTDPMRAACDRALAASQDRIVHALDRLDVTTIDADEIETVGSLETLENVNTVDELESASGRLSDHENTA